MPEARPIALNIARLVAAIETFHGIFALTAPVAFTNYFALSNLDERSSILFAQGTGSRNLTWGSAALILSFCSGRDNARNAGVMLGCLVVAGLTDAYLCYEYGRKAGLHLIATGLLGVTAAFLLR